MLVSVAGQKGGAGGRGGGTITGRGDLFYGMREVWFKFRFCIPKTNIIQVCYQVTIDNNSRTRKTEIRDFRSLGRVGLGTRMNFDNLKNYLLHTAIYEEQKTTLSSVYFQIVKCFFI